MLHSARLLSLLTVTFSSLALAQTPAPVATGSAAKEIVVLQPFEVVTDKADSYEALNFSSLSGTNRSLDKLPITAEIFNSTLMSDLGTTDMLSLLNNYATAITPGENSAGSPTAEGTREGDRFSFFRMGIRGLNAGPIRRNGFLDNGYLAEGFSVERMEIIRGPQALLYGPNPPGGVVNVMTKKAVFGRNFFSPQAQVDSQGTRRAQFDANLAGRSGQRRVALRLAAYDADIKYYRDLISRDSYGQYAEAAVELWPSSSTVLRFEWENLMDYAIEPAGRLLVAGVPSVVPDNTELPLLLARQDPALARIANGRINWSNVDSTKGTSNATLRHLQNFAVSLSSQFAPWLHGQISAAKYPRYSRRVNASGFTQLRAPLTGGNPLDAWAVGYRPQIAPIVTQAPDGVRGILTADFKLTRLTKNNLVLGADTQRTGNDQYTYDYFEADASGVVINRPTPAQINTVNQGRALMPIQWVDIQNNLPGYVALRQDRYVFNNRTYVLDRQKSPNPSLATPDNPLGFNGGSSGVSYTRSRASGTYALLSTTWAGGRVETLAGARYDWTLDRNIGSGTRASAGDYSGNAGFVWNFSRPVALYAGLSRNFRPGSSFGFLGIDGQPLRNGIGEGREAGFKLNAFDGRLSGSVTYYSTKSVNETEIVPGTAMSATDPTGINGKFYIQQPSINYDRKTEGAEVTLSAKPLRNWRVQLGYSHNVGREGSAVYLPYRYNDEFRANAQGQVLLADNTLLLVPVSTAIRVASDGKTYAAGVATQPMTVTMLKQGDASGNYRAQLSPDNGQILNASALGLAVPGVGTGRVGLPIAQHQLGFVSPLGAGLLVRRGGDVTTGYPLDSFTITSMHRFTDGMFQGWGAGFNASINRTTLLYYYNDADGGNVRRAFYAPNRALLNLILSYERKLTPRISWKTQFNFNNVGNRRDLTIYPNVTTGRPNNAILRTSPYTLVWTNTLTF